MKINRSTHFMILVLFAIAFVVIYLYYTIKDVKKIHVEVARLSNDVLQLTQSISNITNTLLNQNTQGVAASAGVCFAPFTPSTPQVPEVPQVQVTVPDTAAPESVSGDSVASAEMHKIIETIDEDEEVQQTVIEEDAQIEQTQIVFDAKQLKALSYDALKKYCKDNGIDTKGTKDALVTRVLSRQQTVA